MDDGHEPRRDLRRRDGDANTGGVIVGRRRKRFADRVGVAKQPAQAAHVEHDPGRAMTLDPRRELARNRHHHTRWARRAETGKELPRRWPHRRRRSCPRPVSGGGRMRVTCASVSRAVMSGIEGVRSS